MQSNYAKTKNGLSQKQSDNQNISKALSFLALESLQAGNYDLAASIVAARYKAVPTHEDFQPHPQIARFFKAFMEASPAAREAFLEYVEYIEAPYKL